MKKIAILLLLIPLVVMGAGSDFKHYNGVITLKAEVDSASAHTEIDSVRYLINTEGYKTMRSVLVFEGPFSGDSANYDASAVGKVDTIWMVLESMGWGDSATVDSAYSVGLPCTLKTYVLEAVGDTLFREKLRVNWKLADSCGDGLDSAFFDMKYKLWYDIYLK